jgi:hypothetical protein
MNLSNNSRQMMIVAIALVAIAVLVTASVATASLTAQSAEAAKISKVTQSKSNTVTITQRLVSEGLGGGGRGDP